MFLLFPIGVFSFVFVFIGDIKGLFTKQLVLEFTCLSLSLFYLMYQIVLVGFWYIVALFVYIFSRQLELSFWRENR